MDALPYLGYSSRRCLPSHVNALYVEPKSDSDHFLEDKFHILHTINDNHRHDNRSKMVGVAWNSAAGTH
jgi:hypothetical protein